MNALVPISLLPDDLQDFDGEALVQDMRLSGLLGYADVKNVRRLINRNRAELEGHGVLRQIDAKPPQGSLGGRPEQSFMLNEAQAILITMFSRTERAADARRQIIQVFLAWRHGKLAPILPALEQPKNAHQPSLETSSTQRFMLECHRIAAEKGYASVDEFGLLFMKRGDGKVSDITKDWLKLSALSSWGFNIPFLTTGVYQITPQETKIVHQLRSEASERHTLPEA